MKVEALISAYQTLLPSGGCTTAGRLNERVLQMPQIFPNARADNRVICVTGIGEGTEFSALIVDALPDYKLVYNGQGFPLNLYDKIEVGDGGDLFQEQGNSGYRKQDGISDYSAGTFPVSLSRCNHHQIRSVLLSVWHPAFRGLPEPVSQQSDEATAPSAGGV